MVHRKSNYSLTYKKINPNDLRSLYEENTINRHLYGTAHQVHQPLPFEEEPCECDEDVCKTTPPRRSEARKPKRNFKSASMGPVRPTHSPLVSSQLKRSSSSKDLSPWRDKSAEHKHSKDHNDSLLHRCAFCGKDFKSMNGGYVAAQTKQGSEEQDSHVAAKASSRIDRDLGHSSSGSGEQRKSGNDTFIRNKSEAVGAAASVDPVLEHTVRFAKPEPDQGFLGVLKCHPLFREYDLIPATLPPCRPRPPKVEGKTDWNAGGDRVSEPARLRRPHSGQRSASSLGRLSASTGNITATHGVNASSERLDVRGVTRRLHGRCPAPCATVPSRGASQGQHPPAGGASAQEFSEMSRCHNCRQLCWSRSP